MEKQFEQTEISNVGLLDAERRFKVERLSSRAENDVKVDVVANVLSSVKSIGRYAGSVVALAMVFDQYNRAYRVPHHQMVTEQVLWVFIGSMAFLAGVLFLSITRMDLFAKVQGNDRKRR